MSTRTAQMFPRDAAEPASGEERFTEAAAAKRFALRHGTEVRFDHRRRRWLIWQGHRWAPDVDGAITRKGLDFARDWQRETMNIRDARERERAFKAAIRFERRDALVSLFKFAADLPPIADAGDRWDRDPWLLGVPNGVVDLRTGTLRDGRPTDAITMQTTVAYDASAPCPRWEQFVREVFAADLDVSTFVHRAIGYSLTGVTSEQVLFMAYGTGANGKGSCINTVAQVLGDYATNMPFATIEMRDRAAIPNDLAALVGRRFVSASETNDGTRLNESRVKALTGCDPVTARFLHGEFFTFEPVGKFWLSVNHKPIVRDDSHGFWRRLRVIPFTQRFPVTPSLADDLRAEAAGILAWCVRGALAWQCEGLGAPAVIADATAEYEADSDPVGRFLTEACEFDTEAEVSGADIFDHYKCWADAHRLTDRERLTSTMLGRKLGERFQRVKTRHGAVYQGLARGAVTGFQA